MCVVLQHHLAKGSRCAPPLDPPGLWRFPGIEPVSAPAQRLAVASPLGWSLRAPPRPPWLSRGANLVAVESRPDICGPDPAPGETSLSPGPHRAGRRLRLSPCTPIDPPAPRLRRTSQRAFAPFGNLTNPPRIGCAPAFRRWTTTGVSAPASSKGRSLCTPAARGFVPCAATRDRPWRRFAIHIRMMYYFNRIRFCESTII